MKKDTLLYASLLTILAVILIVQSSKQIDCIKDRIEVIGKRNRQPRIRVFAVMHEKKVKDDIPNSDLRQENSKIKNEIIYENPVNQVMQNKDMKEAARPTRKNSSLAEAVIDITEAEVHEGQNLLTRQGIPILYMEYNSIGFDSYLSIMKSLGGKVVVGDGVEQRVVSEVVLDNSGGAYIFVGFKEKMLTDGFAISRPHEIFNEKLVDLILKKSKEALQGSDFRCAIILPLHVEAGIVGAIHKYFEGKNTKINSYSIIFGEYERKNDQIFFILKRGQLNDSKIDQNFNLTLNLSSVAKGFKIL